MTASLELLEQQRGRLVASHLGLEALLASSVSRIVDRVAHFVDVEVVVHCARLMDIVASAFDNSRMNAQSILELLSAAGQGG